MQSLNNETKAATDEDILMNETVHSFINEVPSDFNQTSSSLFRSIGELCFKHMSPSPIKKRNENSRQKAQQDCKIEIDNITPSLPSSSYNSTYYSGRGRRARSRPTSMDKDMPTIPLMIMNHQFSNSLAPSPSKVHGDSTDQETNEEYQKFMNSLSSKQGRSMVSIPFIISFQLYFLSKSQRKCRPRRR